ncbi:hypothetical protein DB346_06345 [Verrucomicrobia bacterium LW23]|nr:hypothetical protein DB346_06345 [Verrucomicrobia bacterium LW23]
MNDIPREKLREILNRHGRQVCEDARLCQALLTDYCGEHRGQNYLLVSVVRERLAMELAAFPREGKELADLTALLNRLAKRLETNLMVATPAARWALESWAEALELVQPGGVVWDDSAPAVAAGLIANPANPPRPPLTGPPRPPAMMQRPPAAAPEPGFIPNVAAAAQQRLATGRIPNVAAGAGAMAPGRVAASPYRGASGPLVLPGGAIPAVVPPSPRAQQMPPSPPAGGVMGPGGTILRQTGPLPMPPAALGGVGGIGIAQGGAPQVVNMRPAGDYDLIVSKSGLGDFDTIEAAVNAALPGNIIMVQAGVYNESLLIRRNVTLLADLSSGQVILNSDGSCLDVQADVSITGFTMQAYTDAVATPASLVRVQRGRAMLLGCSMGGPCSAAVEVFGGASATLDTCTIFKSSGCGLLLRPDGAAQVEGCRIQRTSESAVMVEPRGRITINRSVLEKCGHSGIQAEADAIVVANECEITGHNRACVFLKSTGSADFDACQIGGGQAFGVHVSGAAVSLDNCIVSECKQAGISLNSGARLDATSTQVLDNKEEGIVAVGRSTIGLVKCQVQRQVLYGMYVTEASVLELVACMISHNTGAGIGVNGTSRLELQDTVVQENKGGGIVLTNESTMAMRDSAVIRNVGTGLLVSSRSKAAAERCRFTEGEGEGIFVDDEGWLTGVSCRISGHTRHGVAGRAASLTLSIVEITGNAGCGIYLAGRTTLQAERCPIRENLGIGVKADWGAGGALRQCDILNNGAGNIEKPYFSSLRIEE